jgi:thiol:disulfide interchange protein DsbD
MLERLNEWGFALGQVLEGQLDRGSAVAILVVFVAGLVTSLTPCVYPMYPVMVPYILGAAEGNRKKALALSVVYVLGLALVYTVLGVTAALLGKTFGKMTDTPWIPAIFGLLIVLFGLEMLDVFTIRLPAFLTGIQSAGTLRGGYIGAMLLGIAAGFVAAPCTAPVLGVLLTYVAAQHRVVWGGLLTFVFSIGMGFLLLLLGAFAGMIGGMPKPGRWMVVVKNVMGVAMIVIGAAFVWIAVSRFIGRGGGA